MPSAFSPESVKAAVSQMLAQSVTIPDGHQGALVTFANLDHIDVALATKIKEGWSVELIGSHAWTGENQLGVTSTVTW